MDAIASLNLACPLDGTPMTLAAEGGTALRCAQGHSFDRSRDGYFNLLVVQHKASLDPGDDKRMVAARRRVLDSGLLAPLAARVAEIAMQCAADSDERDSFTIVDAGCGEGYYLDAVARAAEKTMAASGRRPIHLAGIDISKWAVRAAAKRNTSCLWAVASNRRLPFAPDSVDLVMSMFGFPAWDSFAAVQATDSALLLVDPGPDHLIELRSIIYPTVTTKPPPSLRPALDAGYRFADEHRAHFTGEVVGRDLIADLLAMTPHEHRAAASGRAALAERDRLTVTCDIVLRLLRRTRPAPRPGSCMATHTPK